MFDLGTFFTIVGLLAFCCLYVIARFVVRAYDRRRLMRPFGHRVGQCWQDSRPKADKPWLFRTDRS